LRVMSPTSYQLLHLASLFSQDLSPRFSVKIYLVCHAALSRTGNAHAVENSILMNEPVKKTSQSDVQSQSDLSILLMVTSRASV
ncbi:MAG TPA: hypothetical protein PKI15_10685, partial [Candidatus Cloacimonadota bacterium]|nr:hypothetical protein [Candidatus Cloacimonadota bacterium]